MAMTVIEAAKLAQTPLQSGVIETIAKNSGVLERLPFLPVSSNSYTSNLEETLPGIAFRAVGEGYTESTGSSIRAPNGCPSWAAPRTMV